MSDLDLFHDLPSTTLADVLDDDYVMDLGIEALYRPIARICGPAFGVVCAPGDNLMLHAAIYRAAPGSVIVVECGDLRHAVAGGNVCLAAQRRGIAGFVIDGVIRDLVETRANQFPVYARGVVPRAGTKQATASFGVPITCGGVRVAPGDVVVADEEGVVVVPGDLTNSAAQRARALYDAEQSTTIEDWERAHRERIDSLLREQGFRD